MANIDTLEIECPVCGEEFDSWELTAQEHRYTTHGIDCPECNAPLSVKTILEVQVKQVV